MDFKDHQITAFGNHRDSLLRNIDRHSAASRSADDSSIRIDYVRIRGYVFAGDEVNLGKAMAIANCVGVDEIIHSLALLIEARHVVDLLHEMYRR